MKPVLILQAFGLGDCIWAQGIAHHFIDQGHRIIWPVKPHYYDSLKRAYPDIDWIPDATVKPELFDIKEKIEVDGMLISPIRWSDSYMKVPYRYVMQAKYSMYDLDWRIWRKYSMWERDRDKEMELSRVLEINDTPRFNLINKRFGTNGDRSVEISLHNHNRNIEMSEIEGFSLFDWAYVIEKAEEVHTVSTSLLFIIELLKVRNPVHLYCRKPIEKDFSFVDFLFTKPYVLHE